MNKVICTDQNDQVLFESEKPADEVLQLYQAINDPNADPYFYGNDQKKYQMINTIFDVKNCNLTIVIKEVIA